MTRRRQSKSAVQCRWAGLFASGPQEPQPLPSPFLRRHRQNRPRTRAAEADHGSPSAPGTRIPDRGVWAIISARKAMRRGAGPSIHSCIRPGPADRNGAEGESRSNIARALVQGVRGRWRGRCGVLVNQDRLRAEALAETGGQAHPLKRNGASGRGGASALAQHAQAAPSRTPTPTARRFQRASSGRGFAGFEERTSPSTIRSGRAEFALSAMSRASRTITRGNILNASYTDVGIGVVQGPDGSLYITQDFIASPPEGARSDE